MRLSSRKEALAQVLKLIAEQDGAFKKAIFEDLRKNPLEFELSELAMAKNDCVEAMENLDEWAAPVAPTVSLINKMDGCLIVPQPLGGALPRSFSIASCVDRFRLICLHTPLLILNVFSFPPLQSRSSWAHGTTRCS